MPFLSVGFILPFLGLLWLVPYARGVQARQALLLVFSLYFIWWATGLHNLAIMMACVTSGYILLRLVSGKAVRLMTVLVIFIGLFFLIHRLRWGGFSGENFGAAGLFGTAFMFARILHVLVYQAQSEENVRLRALDYFAYCLSFLTFLSGPLQRYEDYRAVIRHPARPDAGNTLEGLLRFLKGTLILTFICPLLLQGMLALVSHASVWTQNGGPLLHLIRIPALSGGLALGGAAVLAPIYLYVNFSAYMDMVIGLGRMLNFPLPENFNRPFAAVTLQEFFQRWHITMSKWFQDYIFTPVVKALVTRWPRPGIVGVLGLAGQVVTFFAVAFWHGVDMLFLKIGCIFAVFIVADRGRDLLLTRYLGHAGFRMLEAMPLYRGLMHACTYAAVTTFVVVYVIGSGMLPSFSAHLHAGELIIAVLTVLVCAAVMRLFFLSRAGQALSRVSLLPRRPAAMALLAALAVIVLLLNGLQESGPQYPGFIYARF